MYVCMYVGMYVYRECMYNIVYVCSGVGTVAAVAAMAATLF